MTLRGWHADPVGEFEYRYWDGHAWTDHVSSFGYASTCPPHPTAIPWVEAVLWEHGANRVTTHRLWVNDGVARGQPQELALWMVADIELTINGGQALTGLGRIALRVAYPGYTGRSVWTMSAVPNPAAVALLVRRWAAAYRNAQQPR